MPTVSMHGLRHYFRLEGKPGATPLVLVHAVGTDLSLWDRVVPGLNERFQVLRYDLRGHGGTDAPASAFTMPELAADLIKLTEHVGWTQFSICGLSVGALTAMEATLAAPERVKSLALISAAGSIAPPPGGWAERARMVKEQGMEPLASSMVERMFSASFRERDDPMMHTLRTVLLATEPRGYAACVTALAGVDFSSRLAQIACPALVIRGSNDMLLSPTAAQSLADGLPNSKLVEVDAAHFPPVEDPSGVCAALNAAMR